MIPKIIHQSWKTADLSSYGPPAKKSQDSWKKLYPDFEYKFWTDKDIADYIKKQPQIHQRAFNNLDKKIKQMDFFRYLILCDYGGIYSDMDFIPTNRIENSILSNHSFIGYKACRNGADYYLTGKSYTINDEDGKWVLGQAFFGCEKEHKGIKILIKDIASNNNFKQFNHPIASVLNHTGPERIHKVFVKNNLLRCKNTFIFSKKDIDNHSSESIGYHVKHHQW